MFQNTVYFKSMAEVTEREQLICKKLTELSEIYKSVKHIFLLVEYYNGKKGIVVSSVNELRSAFDHVMRAMTKENPSGLEDEIDSAKKHLFRAAYDACEVIILDRLDYIESLKNKASYRVLSKVYPDYVTEILPFAANLKKEVVEVRQIDNLENRVAQYEEKINKIIDYSEMLEQRIPEAEKVKKIEQMDSYFSTVFISLIVGSVLLVVSILTVIVPDTSIIMKAIVGICVAISVGVFYKYSRKRSSNG